MTLDTSKPMMTRDGRKVVEFHVFKDGTIAYRTDTMPEACVVAVGKDGNYFAQKPDERDLLNCPPEPVVLWVMLRRSHLIPDIWIAYGSDNSERAAHGWASGDPANRRVVRVEVPNP